MASIAAINIKKEKYGVFMRQLVKSNNEKFNEQVVELTKVLYGYRKFNTEIQNTLEKLGYRVEKKGTHVKCYYKNYLVVTMASTPSDANAGHEIIRHIRAFWEKYDSKQE